MRVFRFLNIAILSVLLGSAAMLCAQDEKPQEDHPPKQEETKPPKAEESKPEEMGKPSKQEQKQEQKDEKKQEKEQSHEKAMPEQQDHPGQPASHMQGQEHPEQAQAAPNGRGGHIPDDKFRAHFGRNHTFRASTVIVSGQPQFQYGGYSFELVDAWPVGWAYTDDCYIDYIDGEYFLFDLLHPGIQVAVIVVM
jgi:hypothetical protein